MTSLWGREPVAITSLIRAVIYLAATFGLELTQEQTAALIVVIELALGIIAPRTQVTPVATLRTKMAEAAKKRDHQFQVSEDESMTIPGGVIDGTGDITEFEDFLNELLD